MTTSDKPFQSRNKDYAGSAKKASPLSGVMLPLALTLSVQAMTSMSVVAISVFMPVAAGELKVPASYVGIFMSLIYLGATIIAPISGYFIDRFGPICVNQICLILCALGLGAISVSSIPLMIIGTLAMGVGYGPVTPSSSHLLIRTTPLSMLSTVFSIKQTGVPIGGVLAGALVPHLVVFYGWRMSALMLAVFSLILTFFLHLYRKRFDAERSSRSRLSWKNAIEPLKMTMRHVGLRPLAIASFFFSTMQLCLVSFLVTYLIKNIEMTLVQAGGLLSVAQASGIFGRIVWGAFTDRHGQPRTMLGVLGITMTVGALSVALFSPQWPYLALLITCALFGAVAIGWNGVFLAEVARVVKPELAGVATGGTLFFTYLGILIGLPCFSLVVEKSGSYSLGFGLMAIATLASGVVLLLPHKSG